ncbi:PREDICTED: probable prolyl 4-hydroxylase 6 [Nelumbo nucifera]|uniref:procollagen-proline 4-dioxygenase n=1 Tax=Nelumbo nucifera TaxID=4432 RepID=A0A1U7Z536_NELNU|nr:PREDICTED: probable prolyl 4-hydroxylase 6 [Nelumbo nucifera]
MQSVLSFSLVLALLCSLSISSAYRKELRNKEVNQEDVKVVHTAQSTRVDPSRVIQISWRPRVFLYKGFLSDEECEHLVSLARGKLEKFALNESDSESSVTKSQLSSSATPLETDQDDVVARIENRISTWTFLPKVSSTPLHVLHYGIEETKKHLDYYGDEGRSQPLMATVVLYLSNVTQGGEIFFPKLKLKNTYLNDGSWSDCAKHTFALKPIKGNALLFFNAHPNTIPDESSSYSRCPVLDGEKWCAMKFFYIRAISGEKVLSELGNSECTDEEESCPRWAALGECQRNPVYMIGTPDYYGSCRKSCNACR